MSVPDSTVLDQPGAEVAPITFARDKILNLATRLGLITLAQAQRVQPELSESHDRAAVISKLLEVGLINPKSAKLLESKSERFDAPFPGYQLLRELGRGGMGVVYEATQVRLDRRVALKVVEAHLAPEEEYLLRFEREAKILARLNHSNIVQVYDYGQARGRIYIALEFVDGEDLGDMLQREGYLEPELALRIMLDAARGLHHACLAGIVHRDVKPANLLLQGKGDQLLAKVADLGLARGVERDGDLTRAGVIMGTPAYMAPEQSMDEAIDHRADIYALGATLYHCLTGARPIESGSLIQMMLEKQSGRIRDPRQLRESLGDDFVLLLDRMLARNPEDRYQDYPSLIGDLERLLVGQPLEAQPLDPALSSFEFQSELRPSSRLRRLDQRDRSRAGKRLLGSLALLLACAGGALAWTSSREAAAAESPVAAAPQRFALTLETTPSELELSVDGAPRALRGLTLSPGKHLLRLSAPGHVAQEKEIEIQENTRLRLHLAPEGRSLREEGNLRLSKLPEGMRRFPALMNLRSKRFARDWQRLGEWALRSSRAELAAGTGGLVGRSEGAPATASRVDFASLTQILRDNGAEGWRLRWQATAEAEATFESRLFEQPEGSLVLGYGEGRTYFGRRSPAGLEVYHEIPGAKPSAFRLDWDGAVLTASILQSDGVTNFVHAAEASGPESLTFAVLSGEVRFQDLTIHPLLPHRADE